MTTVDTMLRAMLRYFAAEKAESTVFILAGIAAAVASYFVWPGPYRGAAYPLAAVGLIQLAVGGAVFLRTDAQVRALSDQLLRDAARYRERELARMRKVMANFRLYRAAEIALLAAALVALLVPGRSQFVRSAAVGLAIQSALLLVLDLFAERRGRDYEADLRELSA